MRIIAKACLVLLTVLCINNFSVVHSPYYGVVSSVVERKTRNCRNGRHFAMISIKAVLSLTYTANLVIFCLRFRNILVY